MTSLTIKKKKKMIGSVDLKIPSILCRLFLLFCRRVSDLMFLMPTELKCVSWSIPLSLPICLEFFISSFYVSQAMGYRSGLSKVIIYISFKYQNKVEASLITILFFKNGW